MDKIAAGFLYGFGAVWGVSAALGISVLFGLFIAAIIGGCADRYERCSLKDEA